VHPALGGIVISPYDSLPEALTTNSYSAVIGYAVLFSISYLIVEPGPQENSEKQRKF
jgi:hypothetical protein